MKQQLYVDNDADAIRCEEAFRHKKATAIAGIDTLTGRVKFCKGIVLAVDYSHARGLGQHWRIAIDDPAAGGD